MPIRGLCPGHGWFGATFPAPDGFSVPFDRGWLASLARFPFHRGVIAKSSIHAFELAGLRVLLETTESPLVAVCLSIGAGARFDGDKPGLAHMSEHMLFQGTEKFDQLALNRRAAEVGGGHNAFTGYDTIAISMESFPESLGQALEILFEQFYGSEVDPGRFRKERHIVLDEIRGVREDPFESLGERAWREFFADPIGHPIAGTAGSVRGLAAADVRDFYRRYFVNANAVLSVVGDVDRRSLQRLLTPWLDRSKVGRRRRTSRIRPGRGRPSRLRSRSGGQSHVYRLQEIDRQPRNFLAVQVALDLVGADPDSHLFQAIREEHGLGYDVAADAEWGAGFAAIMLSASAGPGEGRSLAKVLDDVLRVSADEGFSADDLQRARLKRRYEHALLAERRLDRAIARAESALTGFPSLEETRAILDDLGHDEILRAWRKAVGGRGLVCLRD